MEYRQVRIASGLPLAGGLEIIAVNLALVAKKSKIASLPQDHSWVSVAWEGIGR
jgi:glycine cleavage system H lipoate-binding protein